MADPVATTVGSWEADNVTLAEVERALSDLRRRDRRAAVRTSVLTLVAVVDDRGVAANTLEIVRELGGRHPSRAIVIVVDDGDDGRSQIDGAVSLHALEQGGSFVSFEHVILTVSGPARWHLDSLIEPFTLPDLPVVVWLPDRLPTLGDPLLGVADRVIIDTRAAREQEDIFVRVSRLMKRRPVTDLSWVRLAPWRSLLGGLFEGSPYRPFLDGVERVEVLGNFGPRHILAGWVMSRIGLPVSAVTVGEAKHVAIRVGARHAGLVGRFAVERPGDERTIHASIDLAEGPSVGYSLQLHRQWPARSLADALTRISRDPIYESSVRSALQILDSPMGGVRRRSPGETGDSRRP